VFFQAGAVERAGQQFTDDGFVAHWLQAGNEFAALALWVKQAADGAQVAHMHDRATGVARRSDQLLDIAHRRIHAREGEWTAEVFLLGVDDHEGRMAEIGRCITSTADLKHRLWNGHSGASCEGGFCAIVHWLSGSVNRFHRKLRRCWRAAVSSGAVV